MLFPADDEPVSKLERATSHTVDRPSKPTEVHDLLRRFNPRLVGFGIVGPSSSHHSDISHLSDTTQSQNVVSKEGQEAE